MPLMGRYAQTQSAEPIKILFRYVPASVPPMTDGMTGQRWLLLKKLIVKAVLMVGQLRLLPKMMAQSKRGAEVENLHQHNADLAAGTLFSHVVYGSAPRAGELKIPYFVVSKVICGQ